MKVRNNIQISTRAVRGSEVVVSEAKGITEFSGIVEGRYEVRLAKNASEMASAFRLRHKVFSLEIGGETVAATRSGLEFDAYDFRCRHLIVIDRDTGATVGTYRLNTIETAGTTSGFYSANEFTIENLPEDVLRNGIEIGRACIAKEHRNTKVLFLLWKALLAYLKHSGKSYFFGCCSIFTQDAETGRLVFNQLWRDGHFHECFSVVPKHGALPPAEIADPERVKLPALFNMYLRIGAKVCGPPMIDRKFCTIDFFVVFDVTKMNEKYRRMFAA